MIQDLKRSGLNANTIKKLLTKPLTVKATEKMLAQEYDYSAASYLLPYFGIDGKKAKNFFRVRYIEEPPKGGFGAKKKARRYSQPEGTSPRFYFPPLVDWEAIVSNPDIPIVITEGEKKAAKACQEGIACFAIGGVWAWLTNKKPIEDFANVEWKKREVMLCFDSDLWSNDKVLHALDALADELFKRGAAVYFKYLPDEDDKVGLDDYLLEHSVSDFEDLDVDAYADLDPLLSMNKSWCIIKEMNLYLHIPSKEIYKSRRSLSETMFGNKEFIKVHGDGKKEVENLFIAWVKWANRREHGKIVYSPGEPSVTEDNNINLWTGWGTSPKKGSIAPFKALFNTMFGDLPKEQYDWVWQWFAYPIQYPGAKLNSAILVWGGQGVGKTFLGEIIQRIYGDNGYKLGPGRLHGNFNSWVKYKQFILGEEVSSSDKRTDADRLKDLITGRTITIEPKGVDVFEINNTVNFYMVSNHSDALYLEADDRRIFVHHIAKEQELKFYKEVEKWVNSDGPSYLMNHLLNNVDTASFDPKASAPFSKAKDDMINDSASSVDAWLRQLIIYNEGQVYQSTKLIQRAWWTSTQLIYMYETETGQKTTDTAMGRALSKLRKPFRVRLGVKDIDVKSGALGPTRDRYLWCIKDISKWQKIKASGNQLNAHIRRDYESTKAELSKIEGGQNAKKA